MRGYPRLAVPGLLLALLVAPPASAQNAADPAVKAIERAGEAAAEKGAPGTVVPDTPGFAVAPGIQAPVETTAGPSSRPKPDAAPPAGK